MRRWGKGMTLLEDEGGMSRLLAVEARCSLAVAPHVRVWVHGITQDVLPRILLGHWDLRMCT